MNRISRLFGNQAYWLKDKMFLLGDLHNHCGISYGHGTIEDAVEFACQQMDFFSVTGHYAWPDIADGKDIPEDVIEYHRQGFRKLRKNWPHYKDVMKHAQDRGKAVFLSYEYHSFLTGDYTVVLKDIDSDLPTEVDDVIEGKRFLSVISDEFDAGSSRIVFPHHIGYKTGYRGINWKYYNDKACPLIEIISMHGCSENTDSPMPYLHTMGPRCGENTMRAALEQGRRFGVLGCTDHHNASPGSYGFGRTGLWCEDRQRNTIWDNLLLRNTVALSGDPIEIALKTDNSEPGKIRLDGFVAGYDRFSYIQLICDGRIEAVFKGEMPSGNVFCIPFAFGWGKKNTPCLWDVRIDVSGSSIESVMPRFRGEDIVAPLDQPSELDISPSLRRDGNSIMMRFLTRGNSNTTSDCTQGLVLETLIGENTRIGVSVSAKWNGKVFQVEKVYSGKDLVGSVDVGYIDGFVSPSFSVGTPVNSSEASCRFSRSFKAGTISYAYIRALQENGSFAVSSPVFF